MQTEKMKELGIISIRKMTNARINFDFAMDDAKMLLRLHDQQSGGKTGKPNRNLEVYKRAGIILTVTAWEAFIEDTVCFVFEQRLREAQFPDELPELFAAVIQSQVDQLKHNHQTANKKVIEKQIRGSDWKAIFTEKLRKDVNHLNTPKGQNIRQLSLKYLGKDITKKWKWSGVSNQRACERLEELISLRGSLVHRGKEVFENKTGATRANLLNAIKLVEHLADCTEEELGIEPEEILL